MTLHKLIGRILQSSLPSFHVGRLQIILPSQEIIECSGNETGPQATLSVHRWRALWRMTLNGEHGFADGYLAGEWSTPNLKALLEFCLRNEATISGPAAGSWLTRLRNRLFHRSCENTKCGSRRNIAAHYDLGNEFYGEWLDRGMNYSSAMYTGEETLEAAQKTKLDRAIELLDLKGGEKVLEIGCGWGALAERIVRRGCNIVGLTLSSEQLAYAKARLSHGVGNGRADLRLQDYRDVSGRYDRIASIEMLEAVGEKYWKTYFAKLKECLREGGSAVLQVITIDENRYDNYRKHPDFIQRYIFPGGMLPTPSIVAREAENAGLKLVHQESFGESYAKTLREWQTRFVDAWPKIETLGFDQRFRRMWEFYLAYCEIGFTFGAVDVRFFKLVRS